MEEKWAGTSDSERLPEYAVYGRNSRGTAPVGGKKPNGLGLYDMSGNVAEWVEDCWHENYNGAPTDGSAWLEIGDGDCKLRVLRGGVWGSGPEKIRSWVRGSNGSDWRYNIYIGFRLAQDIEE